MGFVYAVLLRNNLGSSKGIGGAVSPGKAEGTLRALLLPATAEVTFGSDEGFDPDGGVGVKAGVGVSVSRRNGSAAELGKEDDATGVTAAVEPTIVV